MRADIVSLNEHEYPDLEGWIEVEKGGNTGIINYKIKNGPEQCKDCLLAIYDGFGCNDLYFPFFDPGEVNNPWKISNGAKYVTNNQGRAAAFIEMTNGRTLQQHVYKLAVIFGSLEDDPDAHKTRNAIGCGTLLPMGSN